MKDEQKLKDILDAIQRIETYSVSTYEEFQTDIATNRSR